MRITRRAGVSGSFDLTEIHGKAFERRPSFYLKFSGARLRDMVFRYVRSGDVWRTVSFELVGAACMFSSVSVEAQRNRG
jgi:hypothetical protein